ncbi:MAG: E1 ubiquitin-activating protein uba2 [Chaenotheca gracillima]|nr:MAG: E1 ubiquitin-activating protein uba2 [Chaenotheca gracillima]
MSGGAPQARKVRIAIEGCGHGTLNAIYSSVERACKEKKWDGVDLLIIGGDFQAVRNATDLKCMAVPQKYLEIGDFHEYYSGKRVAPYLTLFVGGNHEASNHLWELSHGGWAAPNIYYLGTANVLRFGPLRIAGMSGIWKGYNYNKPHYERLPYNQDDIRSIYHVREIDIRKLLQIRTQTDIGISHDWPRGVEWFGDSKTLFRDKDRFEEESRAGTLGDLAAKFVMDRLRPAYWFSAHLHTKFAATVPWKQTESPAISEAHGASDSATAPLVENAEEIALDGDANVPPQPVEDATSGVSKNADEIELGLEDEEPEESPEKPGQTKNLDEIDLGLDEEPEKAPASLDEIGSGPDTTEPDRNGEVPQTLRDQLPAAFAAPPAQEPRQRPAPTPKDTSPPPEITNKTTKFLALDKCLPKRKFLQLMEVDPVSSGTDASENDFRLSYDKEWLAITRVFAADVHLGDRRAFNAPDKGQPSYLPLIKEEEQWVEENIVSPGKLAVPTNFEPTAPFYEEADGVHSKEVPTEYNNPQTAQYCELLGIENKFFASDEEKAERMRNAPIEDESSRAGQHRGRGRGGRGGGRGRGRGRGRGWR